MITTSSARLGRHTAALRLRKHLRGVVQGASEAWADGQKAAAQRGHQVLAWQTGCKPI